MLLAQERYIPTGHTMFVQNVLLSIMEPENVVGIAEVRTYKERSEDW